MTTSSNVNYIKWISKEQVEKDTLLWLSELKSIKKEQSFFLELLIFCRKKNPSKEVADKLRLLINKLLIYNYEVNYLEKKVKQHFDHIYILTDGKNQINAETAFKKEHQSFQKRIDILLSGYRKHKNNILNILTKTKRKIRDVQPMIQV